MNFLSLYSLKNNIPDLIFKSPVLYFSPIIKTEYLPENIQKKMIVFKSANLLLIKNILLFTIIDLLRSPLILVKKLNQQQDYIPHTYAGGCNAPE